MCGAQNESSQGAPQWRADYFELKAIIVSGSRETLPPI